MKITENQLKQIIDEEIQAMVKSGEIDEGFLDRMKARGSGAISKMKTGAAGMVQKGLGSALGAAGKMGAGDVATKAGADLKQAAADAKTAGATKAKATKAASILNSHLKALNDDLEILGVNLDQPDVKKAIAALQQAVDVSTKRAAR
jgi:hypothetical protein